MSFKQFVTGYLQQKVKTAEEAKKDFAETISSNLKVFLSSLQDKQSAYVKEMGSAKTRLTEITNLEGVEGFSGAELAAIALNPELTERVKKNITNPYIRNKITEAGMFIQNSDKDFKKTGNLSAEQYIDLVVKNRLNDIYPNKNMMLSNLEELTDDDLFTKFAVKPFVKRKSALARAKAEEFKSMYGFDTKQKLDVDPAKFRVRPGIFDAETNKEKLEQEQDKLIAQLDNIEEPSSTKGMIIMDKLNKINYNLSLYDPKTKDLFSNSFIRTLAKENIRREIDNRQLSIGKGQEVTLISDGFGGYDYQITNPKLRAEVYGVAFNEAINNLKNIYKDSPGLFTKDLARRYVGIYNSMFGVNRDIDYFMKQINPSGLASKIDNTTGGGGAKTVPVKTPKVIKLTGNAEKLRNRLAKDLANKTKTADQIRKEVAEAFRKGQLNNQNEARDILRSLDIV
tara:strand:- start:3646 stop:5007 length:1362 start_codon:yes stop_codon:yes gene_type:complete